MENKIIIFCFAGRKKYLEIQFEYIKKILDKYNNTYYHLWNFSRNDLDNNYLQELFHKNYQVYKNRIEIFNQYYEGENLNKVCHKKVGVICNCVKCRVGKWSEPYKYYNNNNCNNTIFLKLDDDIIYISIDNFEKFINTVKENPSKIVSANVINNGICAYFNQDLKNILTKNNIINQNSDLNKFWNLCTNKNFFNLSHEYFFNLYESNKLLNEDIFKIKNRFSINFIAFDNKIMNLIAKSLGNHIGMNDEYIISTNFEIIIYSSFLAVHFHFSDQHSQLTDDEENKYIIKYTKILDNILI